MKWIDVIDEFISRAQSRAYLPSIVLIEYKNTTKIFLSHIHYKRCNIFSYRIVVCTIHENRHVNDGASQIWYSSYTAKSPIPMYLWRQATMTLVCRITHVLAAMDIRPMITTQISVLTQRAFHYRNKLCSIKLGSFEPELRGTNELDKTLQSFQR
jgi:glucuronate isomerase